MAIFAAAHPGADFQTSLSDSLNNFILFFIQKLTFISIPRWRDRGAI
jgi:hypothetical protein